MNDYGEGDLIEEINSVSYFPHNFDDIWEIVQKKFKSDIKDLSDINLIFFQNKSDLLKEIQTTYPEEGSEFIKVFDYIRQLVLNIDKLLEKKINFLKRETTDKIILNRKQVALIFILGFFDIFSIDMKKMCIYYRYDFHDILTSKSGTNFQKGRSFLNYMTIIGKWLSENNPVLEEKINYIRDKKDFKIKNFKDDIKLCKVEIYKEGSLFDSEASYCVDFANMYIGGGALSGGCVQEEILFAVEPEAVVSMLFMEKMDSNDAIRIDNLIQYSKYSGYGRSFKYVESAIKNIKDEKLIKHSIIAIDAICKFGGGLYDKDDVERDIIKAYVGFNLVNFEDENIKSKEKTIATGNWGCGAFGGDFELKFLQQWIAASYAGLEKLYYYSFGRKEMENIINNYKNLELINVRVLYNALMEEELKKGSVLSTILENLNKTHLENIKEVDNNIRKQSCCKNCRIY